MSASTAGALKAMLEGAGGVGVAFHRDRAPEGASYPFGVIGEAISVVPEAAFSQYDDPEGHVTEQVQIDLWERWKDTNGTLVESYPVADTIARKLKGATLPTAPNHVSGLRLVSVVRLVEVENNLVHKVFTVEVRRVLERS